MNNYFVYNQHGKDNMHKIWHKLSNRVMILYVLEGKGSLVTSEQIYPFKSGSLFFVGANKTHYTLPENPANYKRSKLFISTETFIKIASLLDGNENFNNTFHLNSLVFADLEDNVKYIVETLLNELNENLSKPSFNTLLVSAFIKLCVYAEANVKKQIISPQETNSVALAVKYVNEHFSENITLKEICNAVFQSKYFFCRKFKSVMGQTIMNYLLTTRLSLSQELLLSTNLSINEISDKCGFSSVSYFCSIFKKHNDISPYKYRRKYK